MATHRLLSFPPTFFSFLSFCTCSFLLSLYFLLSIRTCREVCFQVKKKKNAWLCSRATLQFSCERQRALLLLISQSEATPPRVAGLSASWTPRTAFQSPYSPSPKESCLDWLFIFLYFVSSLQSTLFKSHYSAAAHFLFLFSINRLFWLEIAVLK